MSKDNKYMARYMSDRYVLLKIEAIKHKGGKCEKCGYDKCYAALEFHHLDPTIKEFNWRQMRSQGWESIVQELDKCQLLCSNCHKEVHFDPKLLQKILERRKKRKETREPKASKKCPVCKIDFKPANKHVKCCSIRCDKKTKERVQWPDDLPDLVVASSKSAVARSLGISDKAVAKRLKNHH